MRFAEHETSAEIDARLLTLLRENSRRQVSTLAAALGVSRANVYARIARLEQDAESPQIKATLADSDRLSQVLNLRGTPAFVLGDDVVFGAQDEDEMKAQITAVRQCGKTVC